MLNNTRLCLILHRSLLDINKKSARYLSKISPSTINLASTMRNLISARRYKEALDLFDRELPIRTDPAFTLALKASAKLSDYQRGVRIHQQLSSKSLEDPYIQTSLIHFYMQCYRTDDAHRIFSTIKNKTIFMYGAMLKGYLSNDMPEKVTELFETISIEVDEVIIIILFNACAKLPNAHAIKLGTDVLNRLPKSFLHRQELINSAITMLMKFGQVEDAERLFKQMKNKTIATYRAMMQGYVTNNLFVQALNFFEEIPLKLNKVLYGIVYKACASLGNERAMKLGKKTFEDMPRMFLDDVIIVNSAIHMFMKFGQVKDAENLFRQMKNKTVVTYGAMLQGYAANNLFVQALNFFEEIPLKLNEVLYGIAYKACASLGNERAMKLGKKIFEEMPKMFLDDIIIINLIIHMFMKFGQMEDAENLFRQMKNVNLYTYGIMMNGYKINEQPQKCLSLLKEIKTKNVTINQSIASALVGACSQIGIRSISENIVQQISHLQHDLQLKNSLIDMWGKSGDIDQAKQIFQSIYQPDVFTYSCMINAYGQNGMGYEAIDVYEQMPKNLRARIPDVCVLNACSHSGLVDQARTIFNRIDKKSEIIVTTMVDCLSRMGLFDQAEELINDYEKTNSPDLVMYMAILSGARNYRQVGLSEKFYNRMKYFFPEKKSNLIAASVLLSNTYSSSGDDQQAQEVRLNRTKQFGKNVRVGLSWTEVNGELVEFQAHDRSHPRSAEIYAELDRLSKELKEHGHEYDATWITRPLKERESIESVLCGHSEKLAIAFNLIQQPPPTFIQITKNLRVCGDCHHATKTIAKIRQCQIIVRDANRIHHFNSNGQCSCQDHF